MPCRTDDIAVRGDWFRLSGNLRQLVLRQTVFLFGDRIAEFILIDQFSGLHTEFGRKDAVVRTGTAPALDMPGNNDPRFDSCRCLDSMSQTGGNG